MPVRESPGADFRLYRQFAFGDLADLMMLDTRIEGRDRAGGAGDVAALERASRQLLGAAQEEWLFDGLRDSTAAGKPWQILGQQVMFAPQVPPGTPATNADSWDGYRRARGRVFDAAAAAKVKTPGRADRRRAQRRGPSIWRATRSIRRSTIRDRPGRSAPRSSRRRDLAGLAAGRSDWLRFGRPVHT